MMDAPWPDSWGIPYALWARESGSAFLSGPYESSRVSWNPIWRDDSRDGQISASLSYSRTGGSGLTYGKDDKDDHERSLRDCGRAAVLVAGEEEERGEADVSDVHADKHVGDGLGEEEPSSVESRILVVHPSEQV